jgi:sugar/nucleoside kinase (ribokinase family)
VVTLLAQLGDGQASVSLLGVLGADAAGAAYRAALSAAGVSAAALATSTGDAPTALCLRLSARDAPACDVALRTLARDAAGDASDAHVRAPACRALLKSTHLLHMHGASLRPRRGAGAPLAAALTAASGGAVVSLDLCGCADVVRACHTQLMALLASKAVDLVFADDASAGALGELAGAPPCGASPAAALQAADAGVAFLLRHVSTVCVTHGDAGSVTTRRDGDRFTTPRVPVAVTVDASPAVSAAHAAGFLWALLHGAPLPVCAAAGAAAAAEAASVRAGALPPFSVARLRAALLSHEGAVAAAARAAVAAPPPPGVLSSLSAWLWPADAPPGATLHRGSSGWPDEAPGASRAALANEAERKSTGQLWGDDGAAAASTPSMPQRLSDDPEEQEDYHELHRRLSSRVFVSSGDLAAADTLPACGAPPPPASGSGVAAYVAYYLGMGWLSSWVDSAGLFAAPEEAPNRMRRSMSSRTAFSTANLVAM